MCGHGTIGTVTTIIEHGLVTPKTPGLLRLETPAGLVEARYVQNGPYVDSVTLTNVPSFLLGRDYEVEVEGIGTLKVDIAYGGNFYAIVEPQANYADLSDLEPSDIVRLSPKLRAAFNARHTIVHPENPALDRLTHVHVDRQAEEPGLVAAAMPSSMATRRSTARPAAPAPRRALAQLFATGRLKEGEAFVHESIIGSTFTGRVAGTTHGRRTSRRSSRRSRAGRASPATTPSSSTTATRSGPGSRWWMARAETRSSSGRTAAS